MVVASSKASVQNVFADLLDSLILDVASEAHRAARLGFDYRLRNEEEDEARACASARATLGDVDSAASENCGKYTVDVFELTHPTIAQEMFDCMNCGRPIVAGRFAPHLEKCMGKGRKARIKPNSSLSASQPRRGRAAAPTSRNTNDNSGGHYRSSSRPLVRGAAQESQRSTPEANGTSTAQGSHEVDKDMVPGLPHPGKARTKKSSLKVQRVIPGGSGVARSFDNVVGRGGSAPDTTLGSQAGFVSGMAVPVAVSGELEAPVANHKSTGSGRTGTIKGRKGNEKKRNIGQVMAGSASMANGVNGNGELDARSRTVEVRVENSDTSLMSPFSSHSLG
ncbi:uncharacterized protein [Physcomitrium patens]|uniref:uncharacterized protein isoform X2 n=1 Tax=Physcomitrium patens TaxID=3218 RepID=UPI003CCDF04F